MSFIYKVQARHQFAYKGVSYTGGKLYEMDKETYTAVAGDVVWINRPRSKAMPKVNNRQFGAGIKNK